MKNIKKYKKIIIVFILLVVLIPTIKFLSLSFKYDIKTTFKLMGANVNNTVIFKPYSKTFKKMFNSKYYKDKYIDEYFKIDYYERKDFLININNLLDIGYNHKEINLIYKKFSNEQINLIINMDYINNISDFLEKDFKVSNLKEYY